MAPVSSRPLVALTAAALVVGTGRALRNPDAPNQLNMEGSTLVQAAEQEAFPFYKVGALAAPLIGRSGVQDVQQQDQLQVPRRDGSGPLHMLSDPKWQPKLLVYVKFVKVQEEDNEAELVLPIEWVNNLDLDQEISLIHRSWHATQHHKTSIFQATSKHEPKHDIVIKVTDADDHQSEREMMIWHQISYLASQGSIDTWGIMPCYESRMNSRDRYYLMPKADSDLKEHLMNRRIDVMMKERAAKAESASSASPMESQEQKSPQSELIVPLPLEEALTMTIDLLHGVESLCKAGIVDGDLSPENVLIKDGRAFITDFGHSGVVEPEGVDPPSSKIGLVSLMAEESIDGDFVGSAYRHAPEMVNGVPLGPKQSVWSVGLMLAEMVLGQCPTLIDPSNEDLDLDHDTKGREEIRRRIREDFNIADVKGFSELPVQLQEVLQGMLERYPARRVSPDKARQLLEVFSQSQGHELPVMPEWPDLSKQWHVQLEA